MNKLSVILRCDDIADSQDSQRCRDLWEMAHDYGFKQILACITSRFGENVDVVKAVKEALLRGDILGLHGHQHVTYKRMPFDEQLAQMKKGVDVLMEFLGIPPSYFVPPYSTFNENTIRAASILNMQTQRNVIEFRRFRQLPRHDKKGLIYILYHPHRISLSTFESQLNFVRSEVG